VGPQGFWYGNDALWVILRVDGVFSSTKFGWWRVAQGQLHVAGKRLDAPAPPLQARVADGYGDTGFQGGPLEFPTPGCWEVTGSIADKTLSFVVNVYPRMYWPFGGSCADLADTIRNSDAVMLGEVEGGAPDRPGFAWRTIRVIRLWKGSIPTGERLDLLQHVTFETPLEQGKSYVLFLVSRPGSAWRIHCPHRTLAEVSGDRVLLLQGDKQIPALWSSDTLADLEIQITAR
jgi:hypothetical protein